jgi:small subunit ribosomal protein S1
MSIDTRSETGGRIVRESAGTLSPESGRRTHSEQGEEETTLHSQKRGAAQGTPASDPAASSAPAPGGVGVRNRLSQKSRNLRQRLRKLLKSGDYDRERLRRGKVLEATIASIGEHDMVVDLGAKRDGIILPRDLELVDDEEYIASLKVGDTIPVVVLKLWGGRDGIVVSLNKGLQERDWLRAQELVESEEIIEAEVVEVNRGGVLVQFGRLQGFVPNSHLTSLPQGLNRKQLRQAKSELVGQRLALKVLEVNQRRRRLVLSERLAQRQKREQLLEELVEGDVRTGVVRNLVDFGAFVDLGGIDGLIHISELDWAYVEHPGDVLNVGGEVEVYVLDVDREDERIGLSRKRLLPDPWEQVTETLHEGDIVEGIVTSIAPFGVFVDVGQGVEGLVHNSEIPGGDAAQFNLDAGVPVVVRVLGIDRWEKQISLRLREVLSEI